MNKGDLIAKVAAESTGASKAAVEGIVNSTLDAFKSAFKRGDSVTLVGFGTFSVRQRAARKGRNPQTDAPLTIAARKVVHFKPSKDLL